MRSPEILKREIQNLDEIILSSNELLKEFPQDEILKLNIEQAEYRKKEIIGELEAIIAKRKKYSVTNIRNKKGITTKK